MDFIETDNEIIFSTAIRDIKAKPGAGNIYLPPEIFVKMGLPIDTPLKARYDKKNKELCFKLLNY